MSFLNSLLDRQLVGLDIGVSGIKAVELAGAKSPRLVAYNRLPLPWDTLSSEGDIKNPEVLVQALKKLFEFRGFTTKKVAVGAAGASIMTKKITLPRMTASELSHQLYWEAEQYIPFPITEVNLDFAILGNNTSVQGSATPLMDVLLVAAKKDYIDSLTQAVRSAGLQPVVVDNQAFALGNSFEFNYSHVVDTSPGGATNVIIDFGAGSTKLSVVEGDKTTFTRELRKSGLSCTALLAERLGLPLDQAEKIKVTEADSDAVKAILNDFSMGLCEEILRTLDFFLSQSQERNIQGIYICGGASKTQGLVELLETKLPAPVAPLNPVQNIAGSGKKMNAQAIREIAYLGATAIGLALRKAGDA